VISVLPVGRVLSELGQRVMFLYSLPSLTCARWVGDALVLAVKFHPRWAGDAVVLVAPFAWAESAVVFRPRV